MRLSFCLTLTACLFPLACAQWSHTIFGDFYPPDWATQPNIDLPDYGIDQGHPTKNCKDIWFLCGSWSWDWNTSKKSYCCRSEGARKVIECRNPSRYRKENFGDAHKLYCLPILDSYTHWRSGSAFQGRRGNSLHRSSFGSSDRVKATYEVAAQLGRIADALNNNGR